MLSARAVALRVEPVSRLNGSAASVAIADQLLSLKPRISRTAGESRLAAS